MHLDHVVHVKGETKSLMNQQLLASLVHFVEVETCKETKAALSYSATNIRFYRSFYNLESTSAAVLQPLGYSSEAASMQYKKISDLPLADIR